MTTFRPAAYDWQSVFFSRFRRHLSCPNASLLNASTDEISHRYEDTDPEADDGEDDEEEEDEEAEGEEDDEEEEKAGKD